MEIWINVKAGLCNNFFQIALGKALAKKYPEKEIKFFLPNDEEKYQPDIKERLNFYFPDITLYNEKDIPHKQYILNREGGSSIYYNIDTSSDAIVLGYFQTPLYWGDDYKYIQDFTPTRAKIVDEIKKVYSDIDFSDYVSIHIRTYANEPYYDAITRSLGVIHLSWYKQAIATFPSTQKFIIISDDIPLVKKHFTGSRFIFADKKSNIIASRDMDLFIPTLCKGNIIGNSTFGWWGAFLNQAENKQVIAPYPFFKQYENNKDIYPILENWTLLPSIYTNKNMKNYQKFAITSIINNDYVDGGIALIKSFLLNNFWFNGDIIIMYSDTYFPLSKENQDILSSLYDSIVFHKIDESKYSKVLEHYADKGRQPFYKYCFLKADIFTLGDYDTVIYFDSDMMVVQSIRELFRKEKDYYMAVAQDDFRSTMAEGKTREGEWLNAGFLVAYKKAMTQKFFNAFMSYSENFEFTNEPHYDGNFAEQDCLNLFLNDYKCQILPPRYDNPKPWMRMYNGEMLDTKIVHFWWGEKPWRGYYLESQNTYKLWKKYFDYNMNTTNVLKTMVCAIGRMENKYIREWVEHYKQLGFTNVCLFDNNQSGEEHFEDVLKDYIDSGFVILKDYRNKKVCQLKAYQECYNQYKSDYDWIAFFDCDEYLTLNENLSLQDFLSSGIYDQYNILHLNWMCYGDGGLLEISGNTLLDTITEPLPLDMHVTSAPGSIIDNAHTKAIVRGGLDDIVWNSNPHSPSTNGSKGCDVHGQPISDNASTAWYVPNPTYDIAYLKHYTTKTVTDFAGKVYRGFPDQKYTPQLADQIINEFFKRNEITEEKKAILEDAKKRAFEPRISKRCCIVIPIWTLSLSQFQLASLRRGIDVWKDKYDIILLAPNKLDCEPVAKLTNCHTLKVVKFDDSFFVSNIAYSKLLIQPGFYSTFKEYEYMLIYQLDAWVFEDNLEYFMDLDYDYIGAPHLILKENLVDTFYSGGENGGFSLRKIESLKNFLIKYEDQIKDYVILEDRIFSEAGAKVLKIAPFEVAKSFSWHDEPEKWYVENGNRLPMGCHAPEVHNWAFYADKIPVYPLISIIIPVYNMEKYISDAIYSVKNQTYQNWECVIVNDGSTDKSEEIIMSIIKDDTRFKYVWQTNKGVASARNNGIRLSRGKYILPLDADNMLMNTYAAEGVIFLESAPQYALYYGQFITFGDCGTRYFNPIFQSYKELLQNNCIDTCSIFRRSDFDRIGGYDEKIPGYEDYEFNVRLLYHNDKVMHTNDVVCIYRDSFNSRNKETLLNKDKECRKWIYDKNKAIYDEYGLDCSK